MKTIRLVPLVTKETQNEINRLMTSLQRDNRGRFGTGTRVELRRLVSKCIDEAYELGKDRLVEEEQRVEIKIQPIFDNQADKMRYGQLNYAVKELARRINEPVESTECRLGQYLKSRGVCSL